MAFCALAVSAESCLSRIRYDGPIMPIEISKRQTRDAAFARLLESADPEERFRHQLISARLRMGWTQTQLAQRLGTQQSAVARMENGGISPTIKALRKLAEVTHSRLVVRLDET
jgi:ribosome-binding protein aMBF1 (putative translation factor)